LTLGTRVHVNDHALSRVERRPVWHAKAVRIAGLDEVREVLLHDLRDLVIIRRPGVDLVRAEIAHRVLDFGGMRCSARCGPLIGCPSGSRDLVPILRAQRRTWAGIEIIISWLA